jgi:hypothetical protein
MTHQEALRKARSLWDNPQVESHISEDERFGLFTVSGHTRPTTAAPAKRVAGSGGSWEVAFLMAKAWATFEESACP